MVTNKQHTIVGQNSAPHMSTVDIECPFCGAITRAYKWSLAGSGKRCTGCGAVHCGLGVTKSVVK